MTRKLLSAVALVASLITGFATAKAQNPMMEPLPLDSAIRYGTLPNGLTYFVRHNEYPKGQADFFIAQKVGSILEEDNQRGLAHFLEHMAFNGTTNFPDNKLREWLAAKGVMFGRDLNAYTGFDETVYNISSVPVGNVNVEDSCLMILHDWACDLTLATDAINDERGVIEQEWRRRDVGSTRLMEQALPKLFPDEARYGHRMPIGTMDVVLNFDPDALRAYYHKWYRPDNQAIIVVGDVDPDRIVEKIKEIFSPIQMPENAAVREYFPVADHTGIKIASGADPEMQLSLAMLIFGTERMPREMRNTVMFLANNYIEAMIASMLNQRLADIASKPDAPFGSAEIDLGEMLGFVKTKDGITLQVIAKDTNITPALAAAYRELLRASRGGFTQSELDRAKADYISALEKQANNQATRTNTSYAREYVKTYIDNDATPGIDTELQVAQMLAAMLPLEAINQTLAQSITPDNRYLWIALPQKEGTVIPSDDELIAALAAVDAEDIEGYKDETRTDPLIPQLPTPGKVTSVTELPEWGAQEWTLSNGAKVYVKHTDFKEDEILFRAFAPGGFASCETVSDASTIVLPYVMNLLSGGSYTSQDLSKYNAGKNFNLALNIGDVSRTYAATTTVKDLGAMLENFYATFAMPNIDADEFAATVAQFSGIIGNLDNNPEFVFSRDALKSLYKAPKKQMIDAQKLNAASRDEIVGMISEMNSNAANYRFYFVGNVNAETLKPLVEQYIASLPADVTTVSEDYGVKPEYSITPGNERSDYSMTMQTPQVYAMVTASGVAPYTQKNRILANIASQAVSERLLNKVREEMGAVYSIFGDMSLDQLDAVNLTLSTQTPMKPELAEEALVAIGEIFKGAGENITPEELAKAKEILVKDIKESEKTNAAWLRDMNGFHVTGVKWLDGAVEAVQAVTAEEVAAFVKQLLEQGNYRTVVLAPEK